ncbi:MAG: hypothetical protein M3P30_14020 [Chloroflexota bacterium]|nr:hypothetical protein [Chloroflexota bacterium]
MESFSEIFLLDLHGNERKKERSPDGSEDKNVFDIQQGVSIAIFIKNPTAGERAVVRHADLWGDRESKYSWLASHDVTTTPWQEILPDAPAYVFKPQDLTIHRNTSSSLRWPTSFPFIRLGS